MGKGCIITMCLNKNLRKEEKDMKKRKLKLYSAIVAITLCAAMIVGATFALFTSESKINIAVNAANVDITATINDSSLKTYSMGVEQATGKFELGGTAKITVENKIPTLTLDQIAPGDKVTFEIDMENNSTIDVLYRVTWVVNGELYGALEATADGSKLVNNTTEWFSWTIPADDAAKVKSVPVSIELPKEVGNDAQGDTAAISFTVEAVQGNADVTEIATEDHLNTLILMGGGSAVLTDDVVISEDIVIPEDVELNLTLAGNEITVEEGTSIVNNGTLILDGSVASTFAMRAVTSGSAVISATDAPAIVNNGAMTIKNVYLVGALAKADNVGVIVNLGDMTLVNGGVESTVENGASAIYNAGNLTITGAEIVGAPIAGTSYPEYAIFTTGNLVVNEGTSVVSDRGAVRIEAGKTTINGGYFEVTNAVGERSMTLHTIRVKNKGTQLVINDGEFVNNYVLGGGSSVISPEGGSISIYGGNFSDPVTSTDNFNNTANIQNYMGYGVPVYVYGGTFNDSSVLKNVAPDYYVAVLDKETGIYTVQVKEGTFVVKNDTELAAAIDLINSDSNYWNTPVTVVLAAGEYKGTYTLKQWPQWGGVDAANKGTANTNVTFIGENDAVVTGLINVTGYGQGKSGFTDSANAITVFQNVTFNANMPAERNGASFNNIDVQKGADNVTFDGCTFLNASHVVIGGSGTNGVGDIVFTGCEFVNGGCISGGPKTLTITDCNFNGGSNGFVNVQRGGNGNGIVTITNTTVVCGEYGIRTNALAEVTVTNSSFEISEASGMAALVFIRGADVKATFTDCEIKNGVVVELKDASYAKTANVMVNGYACVFTADQLTAALAAGKNVLMMNDIYMEAATTAPYGNKYGVKMNGGVLDGNGYELNIECYGDDYGIMTTGGTIKNLTIKNATRAIMVMYVESDLILENVNLGGDGVLYTVNTGEAGPAAKTAKLIVKNSTLAGWTSYNFFESATFENVTFEQGTYYNNIYGRVLKPYVTTTLIGCEFMEHMNLDLSALGADQTVTMTGCTVNGVAVTADVLTVPSGDADYDTMLFSVDLPSGRKLADCVTFN